jgi:uncharacterized protein (TIGR00369 family)
MIQDTSRHRRSSTKNNASRMWRNEDAMVTLEQLNEIGIGKLPGHLGIVITHADESEVRAELAINETHMAPNGFLHAGTVITLADTCAGYGCVVNLPPGATGFTTIELCAPPLAGSAAPADGGVLGAGRARHRIAGRLSLVRRRRPRQQTFPNVRAPSRRDRHHAQLGHRPQIAGRLECASLDRRRGTINGRWTSLTSGE